MGMTIVRSFVEEDEDEKKVSGASVEVVAPGVEVLKHGDKTDQEGKITWTLRTHAVGAGEVFMTTCRASKDAVSVSEQFSLPANEPHDIFLVLSPKPSDPRTFRRIKTPTRFSKPPLNAFAALELNAAKGKIKPVILKNEGQAFNATKWEKANCVPIGKTYFVPVVDRKGTVSGWYRSGVSADNLYTTEPRDGLKLPPPDTIVYIPGNLRGASHTQTKNDLEMFGFRSLGPGGSGGFSFGVLFDIGGNILHVHKEPDQGNPQCGPGGIFMCDPLWDKVDLFIGVIKGLIERAVVSGFKSFGRRGSRNTGDDLAEIIIKGKTRDYKMPLKDAEKLAERLFEESPWMRELKKINSMPMKTYKEISIEKFIRDYEKHTGLKIEYSLKGNDLGEYLPELNKIRMNEKLWARTDVDAVQQIAHEVGAAELNRVLKIPKAQIPRVDSDDLKIQYLTHVVDRILRR